MSADRKIAESYAAGLGALNRGVRLDGWKLDPSFLPPLAVAVARARKAGEVKPPLKHVPYEDLSLAERSAVKALHEAIIEGSSNLYERYPRLMQTFTILEIEMRALRLTRARQQADAVLSCAVEVVESAQKEGVLRPCWEVDVQRPGLLLHRLPRGEGDAWSATRSWLGGAPRLGGRPWPTDDQERPLCFVAQLDLGEIARAGGPADLPSEGALAFFVGWRRVVVIPLPPGDLGPAAKTPADDGWRKVCEEIDVQLEGGAPRWPVGFFALPEAAQGRRGHDGRQKAIAARFRRPESPLSVSEALRGPEPPRWWRIAMRFVELLEEKGATLPRKLAQAQERLASAERKLANPEEPSEGAKHEASRRLAQEEIESLRRETLELGVWLEEAKLWVSGRDPWSEAPEEDWTRLEAFRLRLKSFAKLPGFKGWNAHEFVLGLLEDLPPEGAPEFDALPEEVRAALRLIRAPRPQWWRTGWFLLAEAQQAANRALDRKPPEGQEEIVASFRAFVAEIKAWTQDRDPGARMAPEDVERLAAFHRRGDEEFPSLLSWKYHLGEWEAATFYMQLSGDEAAWASLPERARKAFNEQHLIPQRIDHQMFGSFAAIQGHAADEHYDRFMLLQLAYDPLLRWSFGDAGVCQIWISPEALARRDWSQVKVSYEAH